MPARPRHPVISPQRRTAASCICVGILAAPTLAAPSFAAPYLAAPTVAAPKPAPAQPIDRPDTFLARVEAVASFETLNAEILASRSATKTLAAWCALHRLAPEPKILAIRVAGTDAPLSDDQRRRLQIGPNEPVHHRRVRLTCGDRVLSEADNWFVPSRLTAEMNKTLDTTDTPFGLVVASLHPTRETFAANVLWTPLPPGWELRPPPPDHPDRVLAIPPILFEHRALLLDSAHRPISEVDEHYTRDVLSFESKF